MSVAILCSDFLQYLSISERVVTTLSLHGMKVKDIELAAGIKKAVLFDGA
jgi:hypothetical protein